MVGNMLVHVLYDGMNGTKSARATDSSRAVHDNGTISW
jgi:hypothetical protein